MGTEFSAVKWSPERRWYHLFFSRDRSTSPHALWCAYVVVRVPGSLIVKHPHLYTLKGRHHLILQAKTHACSGALKVHTAHMHS